MFFKRIKESPQTGRLYIIELTLNTGQVIHKIGMTHTPRSVDRMMEILRSWFIKYRYVPTARLKLDFETGVPALLEKHIHKLLKEFKWVPDKKVSGRQEMFANIDDKQVIDYIKNIDYSILLKGKRKISSKDYAYICSKADNNFDINEDVHF